MPEAGELARARWRLVLSRFAEPSLGSAGQYAAMDEVLEFLYGREHTGRGARLSGPKGGGMEASTLLVPEWLTKVRTLFPRETVEVLERHALDRYGMTELVTDPEVLRKLEPSYELMKTVLAFRGMMEDEVLKVARALVCKVVEELRQRLAREVRSVLWGRLSRRHRTRLRMACNLDWQRTIRANLKNYDRERKRLVVDSLHFLSRVQHHMRWHVILCVDCSGSMMDSVIHSAVMAGIFSGLPTLSVSLVAFDTSVVDLTEHVTDPVEVLMSVQLGGGTDIAGAVGYCETLVRDPHRTVLVLVTDFCEGAQRAELPAAVRRLRESGVRVLGLAALDAQAEPSYDREMAARCVAAGAEVAALTPRRLAEWLGHVLD